MLLNKRLLHQTRSAQTNLILTIGLGLLGGVVLVGQAYALSRVVSQVFLADASLANVQNFLWLLLLLSLIRAGLTWLAQVTAQRVAGRVKTDLRDRLTEHLLALGPAYSRGERSGELTNTVVEGVESLDIYFSQYLPQLALAALVPLTILLFVLPLDLISGLVLLLTAPLIPVFMILIGNLADRLVRRQWRSLSRMSAYFLDVLQGLTTLKLLDRSRQQIEIIAFISRRFGRTTLKVLQVAFLSALVLELVTTLSTAVVAVGIGLRLLYGYLAFEQAFFVLILTPEFYLPLRLLGSRFHAGMAGAEAARRIFAILDTPLPTTDQRSTASRLPSISVTLFPLSTPHALRPLPTSYSPSPNPQSPLPIPHSPIPNSYSLTIQFHNVHYAYDDGQRPALRGVSFTLESGQRVALVGPSGAGKSTVAHLLLRFIQPTQGHITVNGLPLAEIEPAVWRTYLAWVPQQPYLFYASVAENISLARPEADPAKIRRAARLAQAETFIDALPRQYRTLIGERGARLSGGQAQRLALARAFLKNAPVLLLDEATANLGPDHQVQVQAAIDRLARNRTTLVIAHRLSTVYTADKILVLSDGQIVETGTHRSLLARPGLYQQLVEAYSGLQS
jgi:thiol reductant ABC exporter CydD subunit